MSSLALSLLYGPTLTSVHEYWKKLFNMLSRLVIAFLLRSKCLLVSWPQSPYSEILEPPKMKSVTASTFSLCICHEVMWPDAMILVFWLLSFKPAFSLSSLTLIKRLFSSSLLSVIRVVSSAYLRLLIFILAIFIPDCDSASLAFHMMYAAHKLNKQGDSIALTYLFLNLEPIYWDCNKNCHFPVLWPLLSFPNLLAYWVQQFHNIIF